MTSHPLPASNRNAIILTGPTSGLGLACAQRLAGSAPLVLAGRNPAKLDDLKKKIENRGGQAFPVVCDMADPASVRRAARQILALGLPLGGLLNNAGIQNPSQPLNAAGWDLTFCTNHLGPFALTDALLPHLLDGANVLFIGSATEDPARAPAVKAGFRGGRYISAEASARGQWLPGGSVRPGMDAYATSKQCNIAAAFALARQHPRLRVNAMEPGIMFNTGLHANMSASLQLAARLLVPLLAPFVKVLSTPGRAARIIARILTDPVSPTGVYFDESGHPMQGSRQVSDPAFQDRVVWETRALLASQAG